MKDYVREDQLILKSIEDAVADVDAISLLSKLNIIAHTYHPGDPHGNEKYRDQPYLHFLTGLLLKQPYVRKRSATKSDLKKILSLLEDYFSNFHFYILDLFDQKKELDVSNPIFLSQLIAGLRQVNDGGYQYQFDDFIVNVYSSLNDYFLANYGFLVSDALSYGKKISQKIQLQLDIRHSRSVRDITYSSTAQQILYYAKNRRIDLTNILQNWHSELMESNPEELLVFNAEDLAKEQGIHDVPKLLRYLDLISCKFGDQDHRFGSIFNYNIIFSKPLIKIDNKKYFCPIPNLILNLHRILDQILEVEKLGKSKIWERYISSRSYYVENKVYEFFGRIFPEKNLHRNVFYQYLGKKRESDLVIHYGNKVIIVESKSAALTEAAKRGAQGSLKTGFSKIIQDAHDQGFLLRDFIRSAENIDFTDSKGKPIYQIRSTQELEVYVVNVTFEPLWHFSDLRHLKDLGLQVERGRFWSISLFDLDTLTRSLSLPSIFIHYVEQRMKLIQSGNYIEFSELATLAYYLKVGNLKFPSDAKVHLTPDWIDIFDDFYSYGITKSPKLTIDPEYQEIMDIAERYGGEDHTKITSKLLDFPMEFRHNILSALKESIHKTASDGNSHFSLMGFGDPLNTAIVIVTDTNRDSLRNRLAFHVGIVRYFTKDLVCMGIGKDLMDNNFISIISLDESPWKEDLEFKNFLEQNPQYLKTLENFKSKICH